jgi:mRNA-degrading endonuclease RelE of RelBE toxin-antitoxin system
VLETVALLGADPRPHGSKKLEPKNLNVYAMRAGYRHRVVYEIDDATRVVLIRDVGPREGIYGGDR